MFGNSKLGVFLPKISMMKVLQTEKTLDHLIEELTTHKLYECLNTIDDVKLFTEYHVFAVWDFMSLLKALQTTLTCTITPWIPKGNKNTARFINEIVLGEETDVDAKGNYNSHFEMYLDAMDDVGASTTQIRDFLKMLESGISVSDALEGCGCNKAIKEFVGFTFEVIETRKDHMIASAFTYGREGLIPEMFIEILNKSSYLTNNSYSSMKYYLERHIEIDGNDHGPLSLNMIEELCDSEEKTLEADAIAKKSIKQRIKFWDAIASALAQS